VTTFDEARAQFPVLDEIAYLNAGSMGPLARPTVEAMADREHADLESGRGGMPYIEAMLALRKRVREGLAATIEVTPENVALTASTTEGCNIVVAGLRLRPEDEVVTTDTEHFGLLGPLHASGATVRVAEVRTLPPERAL
jgi:L-cysteine/cystine lyase